MEPKPSITLREIFRTFLYIGLTGFGGGMAIVALTERVCVEQKKWIGREEFMHGLAFGQILGPFSLNTCTFVGYYLRGVAGGVTAAVGFIFPSFCIISFLSWLYFKYHEVPQLQSALRGTNPVIIALIIVASLGMGKAKVRRPVDWIVALAAFAAFSLFKVSALGVLVAALVWSACRSWYQREHA